MSLSVRRNADGSLQVTLETAAAALLRELPQQLRTVLSRKGVRDKLIARLFPKGHENPAEDAEYRRLLGDDLLHRKLENVKVFEQSLAKAFGAQVSPADTVSIQVQATEFDGWLGFINDMRLVIGTALDITDDGWNISVDAKDPRADEYFLLEYLGWLEELLIRAHSEPSRTQRRNPKNKERPPPEGT